MNNVNNELNLHLFNETYSFLQELNVPIFLSLSTELTAYDPSLQTFVRDKIIHLNVSHDSVQWFDVGLSEGTIIFGTDNDPKQVMFKTAAIISLSTDALGIEPIIFNFDASIIRLYPEETSTNMISPDMLIEIAPAVKTTNVYVVDFNKGKKL